MKLITTLFFFLSFSSFAAPWEQCLDNADFVLSSGTFLRSYKVSKFGCKLRFIASAKDKEKYEINLCDPSIHIDSFSSPEAIVGVSWSAGSANCPKPLFGIDFGAADESASKFHLARERIFAILEEMQKAFVTSATKIDGEKLDAKALLRSDVQTACANLLVKEYLLRCVAYQGPQEKKASKTQKDFPSNELKDGKK